MTEISQHVRILGVSDRAALLPEVMHAAGGRGWAQRLW
ncbi:hypothetical protein PXO_04461 [Xanthomonas oryzae pv. oryzae PXO99A]|uniref:Uncharacterized protein n=1 Tax=Xanthomonas oryzae pv. oryzae (strain PXO99A) TaxID=360094 RepID=A0A0K0GI25_XANOP|nr:hypothetical protein PXO_04461 [Xanthomonas oryzae pv. oryzae PXO99A]